MHAQAFRGLAAFAQVAEAYSIIPFGQTNPVFVSYQRAVMEKWGC